MKAGGWRLEAGGWRLVAPATFFPRLYRVRINTEHGARVPGCLPAADGYCLHQGRSYSASLGLPFKPRVPVSWLRTGTGAWTKTLSTGPCPAPAIHSSCAGDS
jgi:hypothetical protein